MRIYVACLASYNNGRLFGEWIDCEGKDSADLSREVWAMLARSPYPNVMRHKCRECGATYNAAPDRCSECDSAEFESFASAEEFAIHDYESEMGIQLGECSSLEEVADAADVESMAFEPGCSANLIRAAVESLNYGEPVTRDTVESRLEFISGPYDTKRDYVEQYCEDAGLLDGAPDILARYFDFDSYLRDLEYDGLSFVRVDSELFAVWNH